MWNLKYKTEIHSQTENRLVVAKGGGRIGSLGLADANYYNIGWINNKVLLYSKIGRAHV